VWLNEKKGAVAFVPIDLVVGPAFAVVAPFNHAKRLRAPEIFSTVPVAAQSAPEEAVIKPAGVTC
jgi:signal peptidase I